MGVSPLRARQPQDFRTRDVKLALQYHQVSVGPLHNFLARPVEEERRVRLGDAGPADGGDGEAKPEEAASAPAGEAKAE